MIKLNNKHKIRIKVKFYLIKMINNEYLDKIDEFFNELKIKEPKVIEFE